MNQPLASTFRMIIGGRLVDGVPTQDVIDPATGEPFVRVPECTPAQLDEAVAAARAAFAGWSATSFTRRRELIVAFGERIRGATDELARLLTLEVGKPIAKARQEIAGGLAYLDAFSKIEFKVERLRDTPQQRVEMTRRPVGVVGAILPWNYPVLSGLWKIVPPLATGNTLVFKPSPYTPVASLKLAELALDVFPPGVLNIIAGGNEIGEAMTRHPGIDKISFTGSIATGKKILAAAAGNLKRVTLELGGNDAGIVLDDFDATRSAGDLFWSKFANCGQVCASLKRLYLPAARHDEIVAALVEVARTVKVGAGLDEASQIGPVQNRMQFDKLRAMREDALAKGARIAFQGDAPGGGGHFLPVTILTDVQRGMRIVEEEAFGPILPVLRYTDLEAALADANATRYGLGGSVWSADPERAAAIAARLEVGSAFVNAHPAMGPDIPFGGVKESGLGVECGHWGLEEYTNIHVLNVKLS